MTMAPPPFDPELAARLDAIHEVLPPTITPEMIPAGRLTKRRLLRPSDE
ncbi:hypothetical protein [Streptomyces sp. SP18BB07]|nr:hypothetical protein [Streptomyces sp. SP18BB07]MEE1760848.1 hypothetical protein [Streptomyces sp. SP18BB07]